MTASQTHPASLGILTKLNTSMIRIASELTSIPFRERLGVNRLQNERVGGFLKSAQGSPAWLRVCVKPDPRSPQIYIILRGSRCPRPTLFNSPSRRKPMEERLSGGGESQPIDAPSNLRCPFIMNDLATRAKVSVIARRETGGEWRSAWVFRGGGGGR